jgi:hypothetical protein
MNWLIIPHTGKKNARGESNFILFEDMARLFIEKGDFVYFAVPQWVPAKDVHLDRRKCKVIHINITGSYYVDMCLMGDALIREFNRKIGTSCVDVCITSKIFLVSYLSVGLADSQRGPFPVIYFEPGVADKFYRLGKTTDKFNFFHFMISAGFASGNSVFLTETERKIAKGYVSEYMSPCVVRDMMEKSIIMPVGVPIDILDKFKGQEKNKQFTLFFGGRVNDVKRAKDIVWLYDKFYASGRDVKIVVCTSTPDMLAKRYIGSDLFFNNKNIELHTNMDRESYLNLASKSHVFVAWSRREGFPVGFWEQMYLGLVGIYVDEFWVKGNLKDYSDYPYIFKSKEQAYAMLTDVYDNYDKAKQSVSKYQDIAREYKKEDTYLKVYQLGLNAPKHFRMTKGVKELLDNCLEMFPLGFSMTELLDKMEENGRVFRASLAERSRTYRYPSNYDIYRYLIEKGYEFNPIYYDGGTEYFWRHSNSN